MIDIKSENNSTKTKINNITIPYEKLRPKKATTQLYGRINK